MRFLIDMNLTPRWPSALIRFGHEAVHWSSMGPADAPDRFICEFAREHGLILITNDLDFPRILALARNKKPTVVLLRGEPLTPERRCEALIRSLAKCAAEIEAGAILTLDWSDRPRARLLPLQ